MAHTRATSKALLVAPVDMRALAGAALPPGIRRWLERSRWCAAGAGELLQQAVAAIGVEPPMEGLGALRLWGETGERPVGWVCGADPVHLEARLHHLCLRALRDGDLQESELAGLFDHLQAMLGAPGDCRFSCHGTRGYLQLAEPMPTAAASPAIAEGETPQDFLPAVERAGRHDRLQSEVQMTLHDAAPNLRRAQAGLATVNSLWFWGGGAAPTAEDRPLPKLYSDEPLFRGFWQSAGAEPNALPEDPRRSAAASSGAFVAVLPEGHESIRRLQVWLELLREMLSRGRVTQVALLFRDGMLAECRRWDRLRVWRTRGDGLRRGSSSR